MAHPVTHMPCLDDLDAPCLGQPALYAAAVVTHLAHCHVQYAGPCADATSDALPHQQIGQQV
jgi:hypothetical protein